MLAPSRIYYSQDSISNKFGKSTEHTGVLIGETLDKLLTGECSIHDIKTIQVVCRNGMYLSADNRRLWIFKKLEELGECTEIPIRVTHYINPQKCVTGSTIRIRGNPGGNLWWTWSEEEKERDDDYEEEEDDDYEEDEEEKEKEDFEDYEENYEEDYDYEEENDDEEDDDYEEEDDE